MSNIKQEDWMGRLNQLVLSWRRGVIRFNELVEFISKVENQAKRDERERIVEMIGMDEVHDSTECKDKNCIVNQRIIGKNILRKELLKQIK